MEDAERELDELLARQSEQEESARARIGISLESIAFSLEHIASGIDEVVKLIRNNR